MHPYFTHLYALLSHSTAILLFSRSAAEEALNKGFGLGRTGNQALAAEMIRRAEATARQSGLPVYRIDETRQRGNSFGERLANAMSDVYAKGYESLIVMGNDCPSVLPLHLRSAAQNLQNGRNVLGPDQRGGIWMIGLKKADFCPEKIATLNWESASVFAELDQLLPGNTTLKSLADQNSIADLRRNWHYLKARIAALKNLIFTPSVAFAERMAFTGFALPLRWMDRGPPAV